jgi:hypothetical protein
LALGNRFERYVFFISFAKILKGNPLGEREGVSRDIV